MSTEATVTWVPDDRAPPARPDAGTLGEMLELPVAAGPWYALEREASVPMLSYEWVASCAHALVPAGELRVVTAAAGWDLRVVAPLAVRGSGIDAALELAGASALYEPADLLSSDRESLTALVREMYRSGLPLRLDRVPAGSPTVEVVQEVYRAGVVRVCPGRPCPVLRLGPRWREPEACLSAQRRYDLRRARRRAEERGGVRVEILAPGPGEADDLLQAAFAVELRSWKGRRGSALALDERRAGFYRAFAHEAARRGLLRLSFLRIGDQVAAMQIALEWHRAYWLLKIGYDDAFARCSPGLLLAAETIRDCARRGLATYEFLGLDEPWIAAWTRDVRDCVNVRAYPPSLRGGYALGRDAAAALWRRVARWRGAKEVTDERRGDGQGRPAERGDAAGDERGAGVHRG